MKFYWHHDNENKYSETGGPEQNATDNFRESVLVLPIYNQKSYLKLSDIYI